ncbi:MAG: phosphohistidine phosphatase SixA [Phycisphaerae bacterium]|nr:phosphohistidine phosphatase SixA [Phycisphaerae bacterium]
MYLYLVRHGQAVAKEADPERPLSPQGRAEAKVMAAWLKPMGIDVDEVWHSPKARARQTAAILSEAVRAGGGVTERKGLKPLDDVAAVLDEVRRRDGDLMIVGHMPHLSLLASSLLAGRSECDFLALPTAGVACLRRDEDGWRLLWMIGPQLAT